ncbi:MAG: hypothetical protein QW548_00050 [Candidatus Aenigmatarchaeota archaeon]
MHSFLKHFALDVDPNRLPHALSVTKAIVERQKPKSGFVFKVLLQQLDREIDWRLATELENTFLSN